jgi:hypothetical protein
VTGGVAGGVTTGVVPPALPPVLSVPLLVDWVCALELPEPPEPQPVWVKVKENKAANIPIRNVSFAIRYMGPTRKGLQPAGAWNQKSSSELSLK